MPSPDSSPPWSRPGGLHNVLCWPSTTGWDNSVASAHPQGAREMSTVTCVLHTLWGTVAWAPEESYLPCSLFPPVSALRTRDGLNRSYMPRGQVGCFVEADLWEPQEGKCFTRSQIPTSLWISIHTGTVSTHKTQGSPWSIHFEVTNTHIRSGWNPKIKPICFVSPDPWQTLPQYGDTGLPQSCRGWLHNSGDRECPVLPSDNELDDLLQLTCKAPGARAVTSEALQ